MEINPKSCLALASVANNTSGVCLPTKLGVDAGKKTTQRSRSPSGSVLRSEGVVFRVLITYGLTSWGRTRKTRGSHMEISPYEVPSKFVVHST